MRKTFQKKKRQQFSPWDALKKCVKVQMPTHSVHDGTWCPVTYGRHDQIPLSKSYPVIQL